MTNLIQSNDEARKSLLEGMGILADAVGSTLGPKGQCVVLDEYSDGKPLITKDGVTVARNIQLKDKFQNLGVQLLKESSISTVELVGDGTTTSCVLAYEMCKNMDEQIKLGNNPAKLKQGLKGLQEEVSKAILSQAIPVNDENLVQVATISANNDLEIGNLIGDAFKKIGRHGVITVEESPTIKTYSDVIVGMQFDRGYESPQFITDITKNTCVLEKPCIILTDRKIQSMKEIVPILETINKSPKSILIIAQDYDDEVIQNLKINKTRGILQICAVKAPSYGEYRSELLEDLAILTGGQVVTYESGIELQKMTMEMLGYAEKVIVSKENTTIVGGKGNKSLIDARVEQLHNALDNLSETVDRDFLKEFYAVRIARLTGGVCVIHVGGSTELEMKERKDRIDDAVCATRAAVEEGIVPGGGVSFINASKMIQRRELTSFVWDVVLKSLYAVQAKIASNGGVKLPKESDSSVVSNFGYDANQDRFVDMLEAGVINPAKSDRLAFENAFSVLNLYLSTNTLVIKEDVVF